MRQLWAVTLEYEGGGGLDRSALPKVRWLYASERRECSAAGSCLRVVSGMQVEGLYVAHMSALGGV